MSQTIEHQQKTTFGLVGWLWRDYLKRQTPRLAAAFVFMTVQGGMLGVLTYMIRPVFDEVFANQDRDALVFVGLAVMAVFLARSAAGICQRVLSAAVGERIKFDLQRDMIGRILTLDKRFFELNPPGDLIQRVKDDITSIQSVWQGMITPAVRDLISIGSLLFVALTIDWVWTLIAIGGIPLLAGPVLIFQRATRKYSLRAAEAKAKIIVRLEEIFHNVREIKLYRAETMQLRRFVDTAKIVKRSSVRTEATIAGVPALIEFVAGVGFLGIMLIAGADVIDGHRTVGQFMSFFTAIVLLFDPAKRLGNLLTAWHHLKVLLERAHAIFDAAPEIIDPVNPVELPESMHRLSVEFQDVSLELAGQQVIQSLSFTAEAGKVTGIVGPSGAGKSSLFNLITRIVDPSEGTIRVGKHDISKLKLAQLRDCIAFVAQDSAIFDESIRDNIMFGNTSADDSQFEQAADAAHVNEFVTDGRDGFDAMCGPRGEFLSGGQRQRIAIARALLRGAQSCCWTSRHQRWIWNPKG